jgi:hypothetical protein
MCYILCMCVCVGASDTTTVGMPPPGYAERSALGGSPGSTGFGAAPRVRAAFGATPRNFFFGRFLLFLADFAIFS